jgi:AraC-like DNA-binding protein
MVPTEGQRNEVVPPSHARQSPNYACFDGNRLPPRPGSRYLYPLWEMSLAAWHTTVRDRIPRRYPRSTSAPTATTSPAEIAVTCGFADQTHFCRHFRRFFGMTPTKRLKLSGIIPPNFRKHGTSAFVKGRLCSFDGCGRAITC